MTAGVTFYNFGATTEQVGTLPEALEQGDLVSRFFVLLPIAALSILAMACAPTQGKTPTTKAIPAAPTVTTAIVIPPSTTAPPTTTKAAAKSATSTPKTSKPNTGSVAHSKAACLKDENQCHEPGTNIKCQTGGCVNAARGLTPSSSESAQQNWLRKHPGWCAVGTQGAVAPC
jgi:hypothetical protein